jgi:serine/threonine protein kinase
MAIFTKLVEGVAYLHKESVCHRDLQLDNVVVSENGSVKIIDFNAAVKLENCDAQMNGGTGLKHWSAPETRTEFSYGLKCDSWSLGLIFAFLISGKEPDESNTFEERR